MKQKGKAIVGLVLAVFVVMVIVALMFGLPVWSVWQQKLSGEGMLAKAESAKRAQVVQAQAELDSAKLRADAIAIVGKAAKDFPEYRQQEFIGAFAQAMHEGKISQIIYVPTEANIPILEAGKREHK
jgi:ABC-type transport system involved in cytochrome bd biosynthesis fused ATPase/permease subunit